MWVTKQLYKQRNKNGDNWLLEKLFVLFIPQGAQNHNSRTGSQIIRICMEIYLKIDKMVKMYKNSY